MFQEGVSYTRHFFFCLLPRKENVMNHYIYDGPVKVFETCVTSHWHGETMAVSEEKARSNLAYQYKKSHGRSATSKITLPGKIKEAVV